MSVTASDWLQAQYSVLGAVLIEPGLAPKLMAQTHSADFSGPCQTVYGGMRQLFTAGKPVDVVSVNAALGGEYREFLLQLMQITPTAANLDHYIDLCREQARVLAVRDIGLTLSQAESADQIRQLLEEANGMMVEKNSLRISSMGDALRSFFDRHSGETKYLSWPIPELNDRLYSEPGDFILVGGYPSSGKSALSLQCAWHWARDQKVGFFSLETSSEKLFDRMMASVANVSMDALKRNQISAEQWEQICKMTDGIANRPLELIPAAGMNVAQVRSVTMMRGYKVIIIDYVQLLSATGANRTEQVTNISLALHRMAQDMGVTVVALSQLKRKSGDDTPESSDLRESGQLEQDADIIMLLKLENKDKPDGPRELYITKNKEGTCPKIVLDFDGKHQTFRKAQGSSQSAQKYINDGKKARRQNSEKAKQEHPGQFSLLEGEDPNLPFK